MLWSKPAKLTVKFTNIQNTMVPDSSSAGAQTYRLDPKSKSFLDKLLKSVKITKIR